MNALRFGLLLAVSGWHWTQQSTHSTAGLRGLAVVSSRVAWASGTHGTVLRTIDAGQHWDARKVAGADALDFRDVEAFDENSAIVMSSGDGLASRVYTTTDGGSAWTMVFSNPDARGFFDAIKFWDRSHGVLLGDPVSGHFAVFLTYDGGKSWTRAHGPPAKQGEGAFAASGGCLRTLGKKEAWFGSGGTGAARIFHTVDGGKNWRVADTPLTAGATSSGIFALLFIDRLHGIAVGGDYQKPKETGRSLAITTDGGQTWRRPVRAMEFRSGLTFLSQEHMLIAVGTSGSDYSLDEGRNWTALSRDVLNTVQGVWAVGPEGLIVRLDHQP